jgi:hypothetical protein
VTTHIVTHVVTSRASASSLSGWPLAVVVIVAICAATAVALNIRRRED